MGDKVIDKVGDKVCDKVGDTVGVQPADDPADADGPELGTPGRSGVGRGSLLTKHQPLGLVGAFPGLSRACPAIQRV